MTQIRVAVVDDSSFIRKALSWMLAEEPGLTLVGTAARGEELLENLQHWRADLITHFSGPALAVTPSTWACSCGATTSMRLPPAMCWRPSMVTVSSCCSLPTATSAASSSARSAEPGA